MVTGGRRVVPLLALLCAAATAALLLGVIVTLGGSDPGDALRAFWRGAFGSPDALLSGTLVRATPLVLAGLAVSLAFRAGILNIGAEGQLLAGATGATAVALAAGSLPSIIVIPLALLAGVAAGGGWAAIAAVLRARYGVLEVISTIMLNFVALYAVGFLVRGPLQEPSGAYPQSMTISEAAQLPMLGPGFRLHLGFAVAVAAALALWLALRYTASGFRVRAVGANPAAAASAGLVNVTRTTTRVFLVSGALAGIAGAIEVQGVTYALYESLSPGYGYTAIAVALLGQLNPLLVVVSGVMFGALEAGAAAMQRDAAVPSGIVSVVEALLILGVLVASRLQGVRIIGPATAPAASAP